MPKSSSLHSLNCPNCGAPLEFPEGQWTTHCNFCGSQISRSEEPVTANEHDRILRTSMIDGRVIDRDLAEPGSTSIHSYVIKFRNGQPVVLEAGGSATSSTVRVVSPTVTVSVPTPTYSGGRNSCLATMGTLFVIATALGIFLLSAPQTGQMLKLILAGDFDGMLTAMPSVGRMIRVGNSAALAAPAEGAPDLVVLTMQSSLDAETQEYRLVEVGGDEFAMRWQSAHLGKDVYSAPILVGDELVYTVAGDHLMALSRADGTMSWDARLADVVSLNVCVDCMRLEGKRIFALSDDGTLAAFDASDGQSLWSYRANNDTLHGLYVFDGRPALIDQDENNHGLLRVFDPASGEMQTAQPSCSNNSSTDYLDWTSQLYLAPDGKSFYAFFDFFTACVQRWDAKSLELTWSSQAPDAAFSNLSPLVTKDAFYYNGDHTLIALDAATGDARTLLTDEEYGFVPLTVAGDRLLVRATRERGSTRYEIWSVDTAGGNEADWTLDLGENEPLDPPNASHPIITTGQSVWTWRIMSGDLMLVHFYRSENDAAHAIRLETIDVETGKRKDTREIPLKVTTSILSAPGFKVWQKDVMWMSLEGSLLGLDVAAGEITYRWP